MSRRIGVQPGGPEAERLPACVCNTLRMVSRAVTQLYDDVLRPSGLRVTQYGILATIARLGEANLKQLADGLAIDQTTLTRSLGLLERDGLTERLPRPDGRIRAMRLTSKGSRIVEVARPLWAQAQGRVLDEFGTRSWSDAQRGLARLLRVAVKTRPRRRRGRSSRTAARPRRGRRVIARGSARARR